jgi:hypothetical protein
MQKIGISGASAGMTVAPLGIDCIVVKTVLTVELKAGEKNK